jgi:putative ABC transport system permease protein
VQVTDAQKRVTDREVIGVVRDAVYAGLDEPPMPYLFLPLDRAWTGALVLHVRGPRDAGPLAADARRELRAVAPSMAFSGIQTLDRYVAASIAAPVLAATLALAASGMGMALAILGLYAVLAYLIAQRRVDFAIRTAIGAPPRQIVALITGFGVKIAAAGAVLGLLGSMVVLRLLATQFGGIDIYDPLVYAVVIGLLALAITAACLVPARRAAHADPWVILSRRH